MCPSKGLMIHTSSGYTQHVRSQDCFACTGCERLSSLGVAHANKNFSVLWIPQGRDGERPCNLSRERRVTSVPSEGLTSVLLGVAGSLTLIHCASALEAASDPASAGALTADQRLTASLEPAAVRKRATSRFPSPQSLTPPPFPFKKPAPGRAHPCEEAGDRTPEALSPLPEDHVPAQPGGGPASRLLLPCLSGSSPGPAFSKGSTIPTPLAPLHHNHFSIFASSLVSPTATPSHPASSPSSLTTPPSGPSPHLTMGGSPPRTGGGGTRTRVT